MEALLTRPAPQQPQWPEDSPIDTVRESITAKPGLVHWEEIIALRCLLSDVAAGKLQVIQAGDCAEDPAESTPEWVARKVGMLEALGGLMTASSGAPVVRVGRMAGQYVKPRSSATERVGDVVLPSYRGHMVNGPEFDPVARIPDPVRIVACHQAASRFLAALRRQAGVLTGPVWTSHEALLLDYELAMVRPQADGSLLLASAHWPWIGNRTNHPAGAHVELLSRVVNPVACKVGPAMHPQALLELCEKLDPLREPGRLTLIARMGAEAVADRLPPLVRAIRAAGHPVIWMCDPLHGNTICDASGRKIRYLLSATTELQRFQQAVIQGGGIPGGLHLEVTPQPVTECVRDRAELGRLDPVNTSLCDPRLNLGQAAELIAHWQPRRGR